jgi:metallo-beta-lactamase family protein
VDWTYLLAETQAKLAELESRMGDMESKPWVDQTELRDRLLEINSGLSGLISEL